MEVFRFIIYLIVFNIFLFGFGASKAELAEEVNQYGKIYKDIVNFIYFGLIPIYAYTVLLLLIKTEEVFGIENKVS